MRQGRHKHAAVLFCAGTIALLSGLPGASQAAQTPASKPGATKETATLAAGCFWSMEAIFKQLKGVDKVEPGYSGGKAANPSYEDVETGNTGHAESLNIYFDPSVITFADLLQVMLTVRNPTTANQQGNDVGPQYRSVIFYRNEEQHKTAQVVIQKMNASHLWSRPIVTTVTPYSHFYRAEDYHFDYYRLHPDQGYCRYVIAPEIKEFRLKFKSKLKQ